MKVKQLIEILREQPADAAVSVWIDGERLELLDVDLSFVDEHNFVELNAGDDRYVHCLKCDHVWNESQSPDVCAHCGNTDKQQTVYQLAPTEER
jgi:hypothetical protein